MIALLYLASIPIGYLSILAAHILDGLLGVTAVTTAVHVMHFRIRQGSRTALILAIAFSVFLVVIVLCALINLGIITANIYTRYGLQIGSVLEVVLLSLAIADRINRMHRQLGIKILELQEYSETLEE